MAELPGIRKRHPRSTSHTSQFNIKIKLWRVTLLINDPSQRCYHQHLHISDPQSGSSSTSPVIAIQTAMFRRSGVLGRRSIDALYQSTIASGRPFINSWFNQLRVTREIIGVPQRPKRLQTQERCTNQFQLIGIFGINLNGRCHLICIKPGRSTEISKRKFDLKSSGPANRFKPHMQLSDDVIWGNERGIIRPASRGIQSDFYRIGFQSERQMHRRNRGANSIRIPFHRVINSWTSLRIFWITWTERTGTRNRITIRSIESLGIYFKGIKRTRWIQSNAVLEFHRDSLNQWDGNQISEGIHFVYLTAS